MTSGNIDGVKRYSPVQQSVAHNLTGFQTFVADILLTTGNVGSVKPILFGTITHAD